MILIILLLFALIYAKPGYLSYNDFKGKPYTVSYDERAIKLNGERTLFIGGSIHYPRFSEGQWIDVLKKSRDDGLNLVQIYVFWNFHEEFENTLNWAGNANITRFIELAGQYNLFVNMRVGP